MDKIDWTGSILAPSRSAYNIWDWVEHYSVDTQTCLLKLNTPNKSPEQIVNLACEPSVAIALRMNSQLPVTLCCMLTRLQPLRLKKWIYKAFCTSGSSLYCQLALPHASHSVDRVTSHSKDSRKTHERLTKDTRKTL